MTARPRVASPSPARESVSPELRRRWVLGLLVAHIVLVVISVYVMDWFTAYDIPGDRWSVSRDSIGLWELTRCANTSPICEAFDHGNLAGMLSPAIAILWIIAASATFVVVRACTFLLGRRRGPWAPWIGAMLTCALIACILVVLITGERGISQSTEVSVTFAPFVLVFAQLLGMLAISYTMLHADSRDELADVMPRARVRRR